MDHSYAELKLTLLLRDLSQYTADEFRRQMARIMSGATGQDIPDDCHTIKGERDELAAQLVAVKEGGGTGQSPCRKYCESVATWKDYGQLREYYDKMKVERDALAANIARLENELRQQKLIHVGFTNESQVQYVTEQNEDGCFYPDSDNGCYIPVYMLNIHAHRVGPDSKIYKEHCELWKHKNDLAEIKAEAGRAGFIEGAKLLMGDRETSANEYAAKIRNGGTWLKDSNVNGGKRQGGQ